MGTPRTDSPGRGFPGNRGWWLPLFLLAAWSLASSLTMGPLRGFLPSPLSVVAATWDRYRQGRLLTDLAVSLGQVASGFAVGGLLGAAFGALLGCTRTGERLFGGLFQAFRQVPVVAWAPLLVLWFGVGEASSLLFVSLGVFFPVALNTASGLLGVPRQFRELGAALGLGRWESLRRISLPAALPALKAAAFQGLNMAWVGIVALDLLAATGRGLGSQITQGCLAFRMDVVYSALLLIALFGVASRWALDALWGRAFGRYETGAGAGGGL